MGDTDHETSEAANGACTDNCPQVLSVHLLPLQHATQLTRKYNEKLAGKPRKESTTTTGGIVQKIVSTVERTTTNLYNAICARCGFTRTASERTTRISWESGRARPVESCLPMCMVCSTGWLLSRH